MRRRTAVLVTVICAVPLILLTSGVVGAQSAQSAEKTYIVVYNQQAVPAGSAGQIGAAGGSVVASYGQIGVVVARSGSESFASTLGRDARIDAVADASRLVYKVDPVEASSHDEQPSELPNEPATDADTFTPLQWDMRQIFAPQAHEITGGSQAVVAATIDTGLDFTHPVLAANYDPTHSADCTSGAPAPLRPGNDQNGHGTHTAGTIAADDNGIGIVGVAPNVKIAGIKAGNDDGYFFPQAVICSFMFAGNTHVDVTNNSYFADPFLYNCHNDKAQQAIFKAEQRAIRYAMQQGVSVVAAAGNESDDLSHPTYDFISPDFPPGSEQEREVNNNCIVIPVEIPGVIGVSATGDLNLKSFYSNFGISDKGGVDVAAPGGDSILQRTAQAPNGRVLSTYPTTTFCRPDRRLVDPTEPTAAYCYLQGTSMASPHVTGVAALVISRFGDLQNPQNGKMRPTEVEQYVEQTADPIACPDDATLEQFEPFPNAGGVAQACQGGTSSNSWYGNGQVDALDAVEHNTRNDPQPSPSPTP